MNNQKSDYHIHSIYSGDSISSPQHIVDVALRRHLNRICILDHNTIKGSLEAKEYAKGKDIEVIMGAEIRTDQGEIAGLYLKDEISSRGLFDVIREIKSQGGKILIPHPYGSIRRAKRRYKLEDVTPYADYIEVYNGRSFLNFKTKKIFQLAREYNLIPVAGSDAHFAFEIGNLDSRYLYKGIVGFFVTGILNLLFFKTILKK